MKLFKAALLRDPEELQEKSLHSGKPEKRNLLRSKRKSGFFQTKRRKMRRRRAEKREPLPDLQYNSKLVGELTNIVMLKGKKSTAEKIVYQALENVKKRTGQTDVLAVLNKAVENIRPLLEVKSRRVGGATYQIPVEVKQTRGTSLALRWIRDYARVKKGKPMSEKLAEEIIDAYKGTGNAIKKREDTHKMAEANKAFAHYRW